MTGTELRLRRLHRHDQGGLLVIPLDHAVSTGPIPGDLDRLVLALGEAGADAVVLHKGALRRIRPSRFRDLGLILHLSASTSQAPDPDAKYPVATVAEALRLGADAVSVHVNVGSRTEDRQIADFATVARDCSRWGVPLLAMMYARGPAVPDPLSPPLVAHLLAIAAELGADLVKTALPAESSAIVAACPLPVLAAGGNPGTAGGLAALASAVRGGAAGIAAGRLVFTSPDPGAVTRQLAALVHGRTPVGVSR